MNSKKNALSLLIALMLVVSLSPSVFAGSSQKFPETATVGENFLIATAYDHAYAIKDEVLWAWGNEYGGVDGDGYTVYKKRVAPEPIMTSAAGVRIGGNDVTFVVKTDGSLWSWGYQLNGGLLGDNREGNTPRYGQYATYYYRLEPAKIMDDVSAVCAEIERYFAFAIQKDGSLWGWGANESYQLGDGTQEERFRPVKIMDDIRSVRIANDDDDVLVYAIKTDASLWKWGTDYDETGALQAELKMPTQVTENADEIIAGFKNPWLDDDGTYHFARYGGDETIDDVAEITDSGYGDYLIRKTDSSIWHKGFNGGNSKYPGYGEILLEEDPTAAYHLITFDLSGGSIDFYGDEYDDTTNRDGQLIGLPNPHKWGPYAFEGWFTELDGGDPVTIDTVFDSDATVYAHWGPYVPVTDITGVPTDIVAGTELILGNIAIVTEPANATSKSFPSWSVVDPGNTGATISYTTATGFWATVFSAPKAGTAVIQATVQHGLEYGKSYSKQFTITVKSSSDSAEKPSGAGGGGGIPAAQTVTSAGGSVAVSHTLSGGNATLSLPDGKVDEVIAKSEDAAVFDLSKISG
ncbi:MAG: InlB B-repeat-containing protein, partial [Clostridiales Family XIII bacterium]|nr:InlB B-repeat-containing protein [Clostridiales Family XIII bacterium]